MYHDSLELLVGGNFFFLQIIVNDIHVHTSLLLYCLTVNR